MGTTKTNVTSIPKQEVLDNKLKLVNIQRTCVHDGPGIRTTLFFRGCNLRCLWCQNPESLHHDKEIEPDLKYSIKDIMDIIKKDKEYYFSSQGGVTLSGGEPLMQDSESLIKLLKAMKAEKISISAETTLHVPWDKIEKILPFIDLFLVDFKVLGANDLHKKLTNTDNSIIHENVKRLLDTNANVKFRMVMVPELNDSKKNILNAANYIKSLGYDSIELLKYYNMYEDKAKKLNIEVAQLNITNEQAETSIKKGLDEFRALGIKAINVDLDAVPFTAPFTDRVLNIRQAQRDSGRALCMDVSKLKTKFYRENGFKENVALHRSKRLKYVLSNKKIKVWPEELIVGNFTGKRVAGQVWEEHYGALDISFLHNIGHRKPVSFQCTFKEKMYFYFRIFPFWWKHGLLHKVNPKIKNLLLMVGRASEMIAGFNNNMAAIAHFIVNFERILELGTTGIRKEIEEAKIKYPENDQEFYEGALIGLEALEIFADRYAKLLEAMVLEENDTVRKAELKKMADTCSHVPKFPARNFHEAIQSMALLQIALCIESYENAVSYGRVDQFLYPYYLKDLEKGDITYDEAKELLCLFVLKMDEAILVNDGNSFLNISKLFETLSTDQALTFGGCDLEGNDGTNDLTYMLIDVCELQPLAVNMCARINKNSPDKYMRRLAQIYINGCPMPELFSDEVYLESLQRKYGTSIENARNYSVVGCVEPNASDDHFGNTDCANVNLALPLLQAIKGQEHDLWNFSTRISLEKIHTKLINYVLDGDNKISTAIRNRRERTLKRHETKRGIYDYKPVESMGQLLDRFQTRLNALTTSILTDHQLIESKLREGFTTPLSSALYRGCIESGKDAYEGGTHYNSSGIQGVGVIDVADSFYAMDEVIFKNKLYTVEDLIEGIDTNFETEKGIALRAELKAIPKFGENKSPQSAVWVSKVMEMFNIALAQVPNVPRNGIYSAGYYALNVSDRYGLVTPALPSGRLKGVPLANSIAPSYILEEADLLASLNDLKDVNFKDFAPNGATVTFSIDAALFQGDEGEKNLASIFQTYLTKGGIQFQPNVIDREILIEAYNDPSSHPYLMVRVAGYCAYFNELSDGLKQIIINRTYYS